MRFQKGNKLGRKFPKGVSGNLGGRPRKKPITEELEKLLSDPKVAHAVAAAAIGAARRGNIKALAEIADRVEGKVSKPVEVDMSGELTANLTLIERMKRAKERLERYKAQRAAKA